MPKRAVLAVIALAALPVPADAAAAAWWRFEEGAPPVIDASGRGNTGTLTGATYDALVPWLHGPNTGSLRFDAKTDQVAVPAGPSTNLHQFPNGLTVEALIRPEVLPIPPDGVGQRLAYVLWADDGAYELLLQSDASGRTTLTGRVNAVGGVPGPCTSSVAVAYVNAVGFSHIALTYADELLQLFVDGVLLDEATAPAGCGSSVGPVGARNLLRIGNDETAVGFPSNDRAFRGWIDEVRITGAALAPADFVRPGPDKLLVSNWSGGTLQRWDLATATLDHQSAPSAFGPRSMVLGPDGDLYVAYQFGDEVRRHDSRTGASIGHFAGGPELVNPTGLAWGPDGHLYVNTFSPPGIVRYEGTTGAFLGTFATGGPITGILRLQFGPEGDLYALQDDDVLRFDGATGAFLGTFATGDPGTSLFDFAFAPDGDLYATTGMSSMGYRVARFAYPSGAYLGDFVAPGTGLQTPMSFAWGPDGDLYVASFQGQEVVRYDGITGAFVEVFSMNGGQVDDVLFVPEPALPLGLLSGIASVVALARRRRRD